MSRPRAENRMSEGEKIALAQAIRAVAVREGSYVSIVKNAGVRQPVVSLALNRRLVARSPSVERLFEYLRVSVPLGAREGKQDQRSSETGGEQRTQRLLGLIAGLSDGTPASDERLATVLAALKGFAPRIG